MGKGKLVDAHTIEVNNTTLQSDYIVIATGQHSHQLDIEGKEYTHDSREFYQCNLYRIVSLLLEQVLSVLNSLLS